MTYICPKCQRVDKERIEIGLNTGEEMFLCLPCLMQIIKRKLPHLILEKIDGEPTPLFTGPEEDKP